jgi:hypothetical protein
MAPREKGTGRFPNVDQVIIDQVIRENPANRGTETSAEVERKRILLLKSASLSHG